MNLYRTRAYFIFLLILISIGCWWLFNKKLEIISESTGVVVPTNKIALVQHYEGGIIKEIKTLEGDQVKQNDIIMVLETTASDADIEENLGLIASLKIDKLRLEAEIIDSDSIEFPTYLINDYEDLVLKAEKRFFSRKQKQGALLAAQKELVKQRLSESKQIKARINKNSNNLKLLNEQVLISKSLLEDKLTNRMTHLALLREQILVKGQISEDNAALATLSAAINEAKIRIDSVKNIFKEEVGSELDEKIKSLNALLERQEIKEDSLNRTTIRAPVDGFIQKILFSTIGGVIPPGAVVAKIIPESEELKVEAKLPSQEVGYVEIGQLVHVRLESNDSVRFDKIDGRVINISPDTIKQENQEPYYIIMVELSQKEFNNSKSSYRLVPGVRVVCGLIIGTRTVFEYIFEPFITKFESSLIEK
ncbi:HlyD family type I secretion periplasmic adaptor subunit [Alphaproteobacteria bacterium]|nr:HlyD family type I secretion periplasmic adaptor subunit [Alphaproteobacteria bacterium]